MNCEELVMEAPTILKCKKTAWKKDDKRYYLELKDVCTLKNKREINVCPSCDASNEKLILKRTTNNTKYVLEWEFKCPLCGTLLYIINDNMVNC